MSSRVFQSVVLQLKESTSRTIGVIDIRRHHRRLQ